MSNTARVNTFTILEKTEDEEIAEAYGSGMRGIPMPDVEEISMEKSGLDGFGELCLQEIDNPEPVSSDPLESKIQRPRETRIATVHKLAIQPLDHEPQLPEPVFELPIKPAATRRVLSPEQANFLNFQAISEAFAPVESSLSVLPEVADCILWLKQPLYNTTMEDGRLFISANHPSLKLVAALIELGYYVDSVRSPTYRQLTALVRKAASLKARDFQKYTALSGEVKQAIATARTPRQRVINQLICHGEKLIPLPQSELKPIEFSRKMLRYELAVHRLMRSLWPLILKKIEQKEGKGSVEWQSAFFAYGNILRSTQVLSDTITKYQLLESLPRIIAELLRVFNQINLKEVIREEILCRLMQLHLAIVRGKDGTNIREHQMDAAFAFRCLKGNVFAEKEYLRLFNEEGRLSAKYFEQLLTRVYSQDHRLSELEEMTIERYRSVVTTEPEAKQINFKIPQPDFNALIRRALGYLVAPPMLSPS
ncbi:MAG: hypothetical protein R3208_05470 [Ketobacteraceae bacterium]|nr:hypothetical protein [Ketobacteraceae bacterium]